MNSVLRMEKRFLEEKNDTLRNKKAITSQLKT